MEEIRIGAHILQPNRQLLLDGQHVHVGPRALAILTVLAEANGDIITKDELMEAVWPEVTVEENALQVHVTSLRKALGDDASRLHTLRGIGYQLDLSAQGGEEEEGAPRSGFPNKADSQGRSLWRSWPLVALLLTALIALAGISSFGRLGEEGQKAVADRAPTTLAVLPFQVSGDPEWEGKGEALMASMSNSLARVPNIEFVSSTAAKTVARQDLSPSQIGARLGVDHFIEGDVQATDERLTGLIRLVDTSTGRAIWSDDISVERKYQDEFEARMVSRLSGILIALHKVAQGQVDIPKDLNPRAYEAYLDGLSRFTLTTWADNFEALRQMQVAASIEPHFAAAHAGVAFALASGSNGMFFGIPRDNFLARHSAASAKALELDPDNFMAQLSNAYIRLNAHGDIEAALTAADEMLARRPDDVDAIRLKAYALYYAGRLPDAATYFDRAMAADPFNYVLQYDWRETIVRLGNYGMLRRSALECRVDCWRVALQWWGALLKMGSRNAYESDISTIASMYDDERAFFTGEATKEQSLRSHAEYVFLDKPNPYMEDFGEGQEAAGINDWTLLVFKYGYADVGFEIASRYLDEWAAGDIIVMLHPGRLEVPEAIRADPRYHAIFEVPRFKAVVDYRREHGIKDSLPVLPMKRYQESH